MKMTLPAGAYQFRGCHLLHPVTQEPSLEFLMWFEVASDGTLYPTPIIDGPDRNCDALPAEANVLPPKLQNGRTIWCPTCLSPDPRLHPSVQWEGEVQPCKDTWHNTANRNAPVEAPKERQSVWRGRAVAAEPTIESMADALTKMADLVVDLAKALDIEPWYYGPMEYEVCFWCRASRDGGNLAHRGDCQWRKLSPHPDAVALRQA